MGASRYTAKGVLGIAALDGMRGHNARVCEPPLDDDEVKRLWKHLDGSRIAKSERAESGPKKTCPTSHHP